MKHLKPVTKAQSTDIAGIISTLLALLSALGPIIQWIIDSKPVEV
jgi:hypothetical protein